jgi:hypothetical protein
MAWKYASVDLSWVFARFLSQNLSLASYFRRLD